MKKIVDFEYNISHELVTGNYNKYVVIFKYIGDDTKVIVPSEIEGFPVTSLNDTFSKQEKIEEIVLPDTLEKISVCCFNGCINLKKINLPESLKSIGFKAFSNCVALEEVTCPNNIEWISNLEFGDFNLGHRVFENCSKLYDKDGFFIINSVLVAFDEKSDEITIPDGVTEIVEYTFHSNKKLKSVTMPNTVTAMENGTFYKCTNLSNITLSNNIEIISYGTFLNCKSLVNINLPENLKEIHKNAFAKCSSLTEIHFPNNVTDICESAFTWCSSLREITIPQSVNMIWTKAFNRCDNLEIINLLPRPDGTDDWFTTQSGAFYYSTKMRENLLSGVEIHERVVGGFSKADEEKYRLDQIIMWESISQTSKEFFLEDWNKKISSKSKKGKNKLRNLVFLKSTAKEMSYYFDTGCNLELPELEEYIEFSIENKNTVETAFLLEYKNKNFDNNFLEQLETHKEMLEIGLALPTLKELRENWTVVVKKEYLTITGYKGKNKTEILPATIDNGRPILYIGEGNYGCLEELILPEGVVEILENAFFNNPNLNKIVIPNSVTKIGELAFYKNSLEEVIVPKSVTIIDNEAFCKCTKLKKVILENSDIDCNELAFSGCENLEFIGNADGENIIDKFSLDYVC